jgi:endoglucanase
MKQITLYVLLLFLMIPVYAFSQNGFLKADGKKIVDGNGEEVILRGMGLGGWMLQEGYMLETSDFAGPQYKIKETIEKLVGSDVTEQFYDRWLANYCTKIDIDSMAAWGFNSIRLPIHYNLFTLPIEDEPVKGTDTWLVKGFDMVDELLEWCTANEIYLIFDLHAAPGGQGKDANISDYNPDKPSLWESDENKRKTVALWKKIAERYANHEWVGGYDLINEPNWDVDNAGNQNGCNCNSNTAIWNLYKDIINAIRTVDTNHLVILEGNCWGNNYNGLPNVKTFDTNLVLSFHKYWSYNDQASIQGILNLRNTHNVPIWLGESGENSNTWFTNAIKLVEDNGIGWAWWPYKKIGSVTGTVTIPKTAGYQKLLDYWKGSGAKPSVSDATQWLLEQADMLKLENCIIRRDVVDAMFRQVQTTETKPFMAHSVPGKIYAVDYDLGRNGFAYFDTDTANYRVSTDQYTAWNSGYSYRNDGVDIEACTDSAGQRGFNVGWTNKGEWLQFTIDVEETASYSIDFRYAAQGGNGKFHFELDGVEVTPVVSLPSTGGWANWSTISLQGIVLKEGSRKLRLYVDNAGFNIHFFNFHSPTGLGELHPSILKIKTDIKGERLMVVSNLGFENGMASSDFTLFRDGVPETVVVEGVDPNVPELLVLRLLEPVIGNNVLKISYNGGSLKTPGNVNYDPFIEREVENNAPLYFLLPGKFQAEDFVFNNGFQTQPCTDTGGGLNLGYANPGDYTEYNVVFAQSGVFKFDYRLATQASGRFELRLMNENGTWQTLHSINVSSTGGWQNWRTISAEANIGQGAVVLRFFVISGEFNLNWIEVSGLNSVQKVENDLNLNAFYNAGNHSVIVDNLLPHNEDCVVSVYSVNGSHLFSKQLTSLHGRSQIEMPALERNRVYILSVRSGRRLSQSKFFVK